MFKIYLDDILIHDSASTDPLKRVISPSLKLELNKAGSLDFSIIKSHPIYDKLSPLKSIVKVTMENETIYRGRVLSIDTDITLSKKVSCEGDYAFFVDTVQLKGDYTETVSAHFRRIINQHNSMADNNKKFTVGSITIKDANKQDTWSSSNYGDTQKTLQNDLIDTYGGYFRMRYVGNTTYIDYLKDYAKESSQPLAFGKNMLTLGRTESGDDIFTVLLPTGDNDLTIADANDGSIYLTSQEGVNRFGRIVRVQDFPGKTTAAELKAAAQEYLNDNYHTIPLNFSIKALDLHLLDGSQAPFGIGYTYPIKSEPHGIDTKLICSSIQYDLASPENTTLELGDLQVLSPNGAKKKAQSSKKKGGGGGGGVGGGGGGITKITQSDIEWNIDKVETAFGEISVIEFENARFQKLIASKLQFDESVGDKLLVKVILDCAAAAYFRNSVIFEGAASFMGGESMFNGHTVTTKYLVFGDHVASWKTKEVCTNRGTITMPTIELGTSRCYLYSANAASHDPIGTTYGRIVTGYTAGSVTSPTYETINFIGY